MVGYAGRKQSPKKCCPREEESHKRKWLKLSSENGSMILQHCSLGRECYTSLAEGVARTIFSPAIVLLPSRVPTPLQIFVDSPRGEAPQYCTGEMCTVRRYTVLPYRFPCRVFVDGSALLVGHQHHCSQSPLTRLKSVGRVCSLMDMKL